MPTRRPITPIAERGVLLTDTLHDAKLIQQLMALLPNDLESSVSIVLGRSLSTDVRAALGGPEAIFEHFAHVAKESGVMLDEKKLAREVEAALRELGGDSAASVEPTAVKEETEHAKHALVTHWISMLITAWDLWGRPAEGVVLDPKTLFPDSGTCPQKQAWRDATVALNEALVSSIALDFERDVPRVFEALASNVYAQAQHHVVELPRGFALKRIDRSVRLHQEPWQNARTVTTQP